MKDRIFITGVAGFIGFHLTKALLEDGFEIVGFDNINSYYDVNLKLDRIRILSECERFKLIVGNLEDRQLVLNTIKDGHFDIVINLAAQAGVRYSLEHPEAYISSNLDGFFNILEACRSCEIKHLLFASSSSVYGKNKDVPFSVDQKTDSPVSLYAASKKANELMAFAYSDMFGLKATGLRFFTVYGPYGRPDMAAFKFLNAMFNGEPIEIYNNGDLYRDFTYVDDIVKGITALIYRSRALTLAGTPFYVYNIGNSSPEHLMRFIEILEEKTGITAKKEFKPMQKGDVYRTYADTSDLEADTGFKPATDIETGLGNFVDWYKTYYNK